MAAKTKSVNKDGANGTGDSSEYWTKLIIYRGRQFTLALLIVLFTVAFTALIYRDLMASKHWLTIALPIILAGTLLILFPPTEEWQYKPWQEKVRQIERHFID